jgi:hypothetical protein
MKTGRVRRKEQAPKKAKQRKSAETKPASSTGSPAKRRASTASAPGSISYRLKQIPTGLWVMGGLFAVIICVFLSLVVFGGKKADRWVPVTTATGRWTTTTAVFGPQVTVEEAWEADCTSNPNGSVRPGTCVLKDTTAYHDTVVDEYDEYAFNIYYEETYSQIYEAQGTDFRPTTLKTDDWWQETLHYSLQEELDQDTCQYTNYTTWVDDPDDATQEMEVYLSDCEVWDHVTVTERVYEQKSWCQCDVTSLVQIGQQSQQGTGLDVRWPSPNVPAGGQSEQSFKGQVTFLGDKTTYTSTTEDLSVYQNYLTDDYYIGLREGKPVAVSKNPPKK